MDVKLHTKKNVCIPKPMFVEMITTYHKMEEIMETLETMTDEKTIAAVEKSKQQEKSGEFVECSLEEVDEVLK